jgi:signal transduction histidine kinase
VPPPEESYAPPVGTPEQPRPIGARLEPGARPAVMPAPLERVARWAGAEPRRVDLLLAALLTLVVGSVSVTAVLDGRPVTGWMVVQVAVGVLAPAALAVRRSAPALSFGLVSVPLAVSELAPGLPPDQPFLPTAVVFPIALYSYCAHGGAWAPRAGAVVGAAGAVLIAGRAVFTADPGDRGDADTLLGSLLLLGFLLAVVASAWSFGLFRTVRAVYLDTLEERARLAEAEREDQARRAVREERDRIARELHDVVAHSLSVIVTQAQGAAYVAGARPDQAARALDTIAETGREALADMRGLLGVLRVDPADHGAGAGPDEPRGLGGTGGPDGPDRPGGPDGAGDGGAAIGDGYGLGDGGRAAEPPQPGLADLPDLVARVRAAGLPVAYAETGTPARLGAAAGLAVYRLVQESLTNTLKHAGPDAAARVELAWTGPELVVRVRDDGRGPVPGGTGPAGHGLVGMRERVALAGGTTWAGAGPGGGFLVTARLPGGAR